MTAVEDFETNVELTDFQAMAKFAYDELGLILGPGKVALIRSRLRHRLRRLGMTSLSEYCDLVAAHGNQIEKRYVVSALTTNVSGFFREPHHFGVLAKTVWPKLREQTLNSKIRVWSAGCSYGQEPLSIAISLLEYFPNLPRNRIKITATDVDFSVIEIAKLMAFDHASVFGLSSLRQNRFFQVNESANGKIFTARRKISEMITFTEANLLSYVKEMPLQDVIFCRNVMIYFEKETQGHVLRKLVSCLKPGGFLFVGHAERADHPSLVPLGGTAYAKLY